MFEFSEHHSDQNAYKISQISVHLLPYNAYVRACVRALVCMCVCVRACSVRRSVRVSGFELSGSIFFIFLLLYVMLDSVII